MSPLPTLLIMSQLILFQPQQFPFRYQHLLNFSPSTSSLMTSPCWSSYHTPDNICFSNLLIIVRQWEFDWLTDDGVNSNMILPYNFYSKPLKDLTVKLGMHTSGMLHWGVPVCAASSGEASDRLFNGLFGLMSLHFSPWSRWCSVASLQWGHAKCHTPGTLNTKNFERH